MRSWIAFLAIPILVGCSPGPAGGLDFSGQPGQTEAADSQARAAPASPSPAGAEVDLSNFGAAPELNNAVWLNTEGPLRLADLHGKVVLLDMWTFGCINCQNVIPWLRGWQEVYGPQGLVVIGNHYPEFSYEKELDLLKQAMRKLGVTYAVAVDNEGATWRAYENRYWPTLYLIDKRGDIRYKHIGEGRYTRTEAAIQALLAEPYP